MVGLGQGVATRDADVPPCDSAAPLHAPGRLIRTVREDDLADVSALIGRLSRRAASAARTPVDAALRDRLFGADRPSGVPAGLVATDARGALQGFVAPTPVAMRLDGRSLRGLTGIVPMVDPVAPDATTRVRLLRAVFDLPYDLAYTEIADAATRLLIEQLGGRFLPLHSLDWVLPRHGAALRFTLDRARISALDAALGAALRVRSAWARTASPHPAGRAAPRLSFVTPAWPALEAAVAALSADYRLRPEWAAASGILDRRLDEAAGARPHGPLYARLAYGPGDHPAALWLAHLKPGRIGRVLQIMATPDAVEAVLDDCLAAADAIGVVGLRGRLGPELVPALARRNTVFAPGRATLVHARHPAILAEVLRGPALLTGLAGESWSQLAAAVVP